MPTSTAQLLAVKQIDERIRAAQARRAAAVTAVQADTAAAAKIKTIQADITEMTDEAQGLNNELDRKRNRLRSLQEQLVADCVDKVPITAETARRRPRKTTWPYRRPTSGHHSPPRRRGASRRWWPLGTKLAS